VIRQFFRVRRGSFAESRCPEITGTRRPYCPRFGEICYLCVFRTRITIVRVPFPTLPVTCQHPTVGNRMALAWNPLSPYPAGTSAFWRDRSDLWSRVLTIVENAERAWVDCDELAGLEPPFESLVGQFIENEPGSIYTCMSACRDVNA
jgi:hypothetical protein